VPKMKIIQIVFLSFLIFTVPTFGQAEIESFLTKSNQLRSERKFDEAIAELSKAIAVQPNNADLYLRRANLYQLTQNKQNLLADVKKATTINPTDKKNFVLRNYERLQKRTIPGEFKFGQRFNRARRTRPSCPGT
jgi:tetratricopeptide (TPR) repeat protein